MVKTLPSNRAIVWLKDAFTLYKEKPFHWTLIALCIAGVSPLLMRLLAVPGYLLGEIISSILSVGFFRLVHSAKKDHVYDFQLLWSDFNNTDSIYLLFLSKILYAFSFFVLIVIIYLINSTMGIEANDYLSLIQLINSKMFYLINPEYYKIFALDFLILLLFLMISAAALLFVPQLIFLKNMKLFPSLKYSLDANFKNIGVFLSYFLLLLPIGLLVLISFGVLGFIVLPVVNISMVFAYEEIFSE